MKNINCPKIKSEKLEVANLDVKQLSHWYTSNMLILNDASSDIFLIYKEISYKEDPVEGKFINII